MSARHVTNWRLAFRVAPVVAAALAAKLVAHLLDAETIELNPLYSGLVSATVFLLGFLLAGTLADYKESEKLPGELAARTETIADECQILHRDQGADAARRCLGHLHALTTDLSAWLHGRGAVRDVLRRIEELNAYFLEFQPLTQPNFIVRLKQEQSTLRLLVIRVDRIRETSFVGAGYVIAEITSALLILSLVFVDIAPLGAELFLFGTIAFLLSYMILLIKDLDDPFEYDGRRRAGAAEVSLAPIRFLEERMAREVEAPGSPQA